MEEDEQNDKVCGRVCKRRARTVTNQFVEYCEGIRMWQATTVQIEYANSRYILLSVSWTHSTVICAKFLIAYFNYVSRKSSLSVSVHEKKKKKIDE